MSTPSTEYPETLIEKCLRLEARGTDLHRVMITIPTVIEPKEPFGATVSLLDANAMPVVPEQTVTISVDGADAGPVSLTFGPGRSAVCRISGLTAAREGFLRLETVVNDTRYVSNPALVTNESHPSIVWGDVHLHTVLSDCLADRCRTRNLAYAASRYVYGLDFAAVADHVSMNPRGTRGKWLDNVASCELFDAPGEFTTIPCYEASLNGGKGGDNNAYFRDPPEAYADPWETDMDTVELCEAIEASEDVDFFIVPHHTTRTGKHGEISPEIYPGEARMPVVEIHSKWGTSEYRGNPDALQKVHPGPSYVQDLLAAGYRLGFIGGTDAHTSLTFCLPLESEHIQSPPGLTAAMTSHNTRHEIFDAIRDRRCYAAKGERIYLGVDVAGIPMGGHGSRRQLGAPPEVAATFAAESDIVSVDVVRNGRTVHTSEPGSWHGKVSWTDHDDPADVAIRGPARNEPFLYYYVRVTTKSGGQAWSSPVFLDV